MIIGAASNSRKSPIAAVLLAAMALAGFLFLSPAPSATAQSTVHVSIQGYSFSPSSILVVLGVNNTVTWTNMDPVTHTVTSNNGTFGSSVPSGQTFTYTFTAAGNYPYHCSIHTYMKGTVVVEAPSSTTSSSGPTATTYTPTSSQGSPGSVPEFPFIGVGIGVFAALVAASYFLIARRRGSSLEGF